MISVESESVSMSEDESDNSVGEGEGEISDIKTKTDLVKIEHLKVIRTIGTGDGFDQFDQVINLYKKD